MKRIIEPFSSKKHKTLIKNLPFSYFSTPVFLDYYAYILYKNSESIIVSQDLYYQHEFPALFLPKKSANWKNLSATFTTDDDIEKIKIQNIEILINKPIGPEFFYKTENILGPKSVINQRKRQFERLHSFKVKRTCSKKQVRNFYFKWKKQKTHNNETLNQAEGFFFFCLDNLVKYKIEQIYVFIENKLVGLAWGVKHSHSSWVGLHLKVDYQFKGLSRFLHYQRAFIFKNYPMFTLGNSAQENNLLKFQRELGPTEEKNYYYILTGQKTNT